jgi:hypothetical protein
MGPDVTMQAGIVFGFERGHEWPVLLSADSPSYPISPRSALAAFKRLCAAWRPVLFLRSVHSFRCRQNRSDPADALLALFGASTNTSAGVAVTAESALRVPAVACAIRCISKSDRRFVLTAPLR